MQCCEHRSWEGIASDAALAEFDQVPLTDAYGVIEGIYVKGKGALPLAAGMFMAADAPLLAFVESADTGRFRLLLDGSEVSGLVTLSDLQKLPVYALLFGLLMAVEMLLRQWLRRTCGSTPDCWLDHVSDRERKRVEGRWNGARRHNVSIDRLACACLAQEIDAAARLGLFAAADPARDQMEALKTLRNKVCHGQDIGPTASDALKLPGLARSARRLAVRLQGELERIA